MKVLLTRFGGIGDCFPVGAAASYMADNRHDVTVALRDDGGAVKQSSLYKHDKKFKVIDFKEIGPWRDRCVSTEAGWQDINLTYPNYDFVVDFMNIIEGNSTCLTTNTKDPWKTWEKSRNSNYQNWYDLHFAWIGANPMWVMDKYKRPNLVLSEEEKTLASNFKSKYSKLFVIHPFASSLARSWYQAKELVPRIFKEYEGAAIVFWNPQKNDWDLLTRKGVTTMPKLVEDPLRNTMTLVSTADLVISVDTGCAHIAEGLGVKSLVIYSTVPAWTRNQYYKHQTAIDPGVNNPQYYTFSLSLGDPLRVKDGQEALTEREKLVIDLYERGVEHNEAMDLLNTDARGAELELKGVMAKRETWERQQSKALSSVTVDSVFSKIKEIIE